MVYTSAADLFYNNDYTKNLELAIFDGESTRIIESSLIYAESLVLTESVCSSAELEPGSCEASIFQIKLSGKYSSVTDYELTPWLELRDEQGVAFGINLGTRKIKSVEYDPAENSTVLTCYDALYDIIDADVTEWYNGLVFPISVQNMLASLMDHFSIPMAPFSDLPTAGVLLNKTTDTDDVISGSEVLRSLVQLLGAYGHINRDGLFEVFAIQNPPRVASVDILAPACISADREEYRTRSITKIVVSSGDNKATARAEGATTTNTYTLSNFLINDKSKAQLQEIANALITVISGYRYTPADVTVVGNPCLEVGDVYTYHSNGSSFSSVIFQRTMRGVQALVDNYIATGSYKRPTKTKFNSSFNSGGGGGGTAIIRYEDFHNTGSGFGLSDAEQLASGTARYLAGCSIGEYATFGGGMALAYVTWLDAYDADKVHTVQNGVIGGAWYLAAASVNRKGIYYGGKTGASTAVGAVNGFDENLIRVLSSTTMGRYDAAAISGHKYAMFAGGKTGSNTTPTVYTWDEDFVFSNAPVLSSGRTMAKGATVGNYMICAGGDNYGASAKVEAYNQELVKTALADLSNRKYYHASASANGRAIFAGGYDYSYFDSVDSYDETLTKIALPALSVARGYLVGAAINGYAIFAGGTGAGEVASESITEAYDSSFTRSILPQFSVPKRLGFAAASNDNYAMFAGGSSWGSGTTLVEAYGSSVGYEITVHAGSLYAFGSDSEQECTEDFLLSGSGVLNGYIKWTSKTYEGGY